MLYSYPSSKLLSVRRHARFDIEMEIAFERRRRNRKLVLKREFSLMCAKHETDALLLFLFFPNLISFTTAKA